MKCLGNLKCCYFVRFIIRLSIIPGFPISYLKKRSRNRCFKTVSFGIFRVLLSTPSLFATDYLRRKERTERESLKLREMVICCFMIGRFGQDGLKA